MKTIATLGSHSALDICEGAKAEGFKTLVVAQKKREKTYSKYYASRKRKGQNIGIVDETIVLEKFSDIIEKKTIDYLKKKNSLFVPNRSFFVYVGYDNIEKNFPIPIFGNRFLLKAEERNVEKNQYYILEKAGLVYPRKVLPKEINRLSIVKVSEAKRSYERAFFLVSSYKEYIQKSEELIKNGIITEQALENARIEEYVVGAQFNFNFFYSPINKELELLGVDIRRQTNLDGFLRIPARSQLEVLKTVQPTTIEIGHITSTIRESFLEKVFEAGEKIVQTCAREYAPGIIGPFALQCAIDSKENLIVFDVSFRIPGSPGTCFTPYSSYLFHKNLSFGRRIAIEIKEALKKKKINNITT